MFSGIIKEIGIIEEVKLEGSHRGIAVRAPLTYAGAKAGDSISVDGVCLTAAEKKREIIYFDAIKETLDKTALGFIKRNDKVNLEPSLRLGEGVSGHMVSGHIDEIGIIRKAERPGAGALRLTIGISRDNSSLLALKGSVAVNGISLTVNGIGEGFFTVDIIPYTLKVTAVKDKKPGDKVNVEFDMIGKYILRNLQLKGAKAIIDEDFLRKNGFI